MLISKEISSKILAEHCGTTYGDDLSSESFSIEVETYLLNLVSKLLPERSYPNSQDEDISEEAFMKDLEEQTSAPKCDVHITLDLVQEAIRNFST